MPVAGDREVAQLVVDNYGGDTFATLVITDPNGVQITPLGPVSEDNHRTWWADVHYTIPGIWRLLWNVTGGGAGTVLEKVPVGPADVALPRTYATSTDLANYLNAAPPEDCEEMLRDATVLLDRLLISAVYDTDDKYMPTDPRIHSAIRDACCELVRWWIETGDPTGARVRYSSVSIGGVSLGSVASGTKPNPHGEAGRIGPQVIAILDRVGLLAGAPWIHS